MSRKQPICVISDPLSYAPSAPRCCSALHKRASTWILKSGSGTEFTDSRKVAILTARVVIGDESGAADWNGIVFMPNLTLAPESHVAGLETSGERQPDKHRMRFDQ